MPSKKVTMRASMSNQITHFGIMGGLYNRKISGRTHLNRVTSRLEIPAGADAGLRYMKSHNLLSRNPLGSGGVGRMFNIRPRGSGVVLKHTNLSIETQVALLPIIPVEVNDVKITMNPYSSASYIISLGGDITNIYYFVTYILNAYEQYSKKKMKLKKVVVTEKSGNNTQVVNYLDGVSYDEVALKDFTFNSLDINDIDSYTLTFDSLPDIDISKLNTIKVPIKYANKNDTPKFYTSQVNMCNISILAWQIINSFIKNTTPTNLVNVNVVGFYQGSSGPIELFGSSYNPCGFPYSQLVDSTNCKVNNEAIVDATDIYINFCNE